jgi:hypothetical protein
MLLACNAWHTAAAWAIIAVADEPGQLNFCSCNTCHCVATAATIVAGEMLSFSLADYHIITRSSGFGRVGAWLSGRWGNLYGEQQQPQRLTIACARCGAVEKQGYLHTTPVLLIRG